jgi:hypothetical protein
MKFIWGVILWAGVIAQGFAFDVDRAMRAIETLASDRFEGRRSGFAGGTLTEQLLASELAAAEILPAGWDSTYFQPVPMLVTREDGAEMTLMESPFGKISFTYGDDFTLITHSGNGAFFAPVAIVGYGFDRPDKGRDEYGSLDVRGHAIVIVRKQPQNALWDFTRDFPREHLVRWATEHGAAAILFYQESLPIQGGAIPEGIYNPQLPMFYIGDRIMRLLLRDTGHTLTTYLAALEKGPAPLDVHKRLWISTRVPKTGSNSGRNVLGFIYGTDEKLRGEIVAIGAHWDHLGPNGQGLIYNGADDDASGTGVVLELARTIAQSGVAPKRSLLVLFFTGEEDGLVGSRYFTAHPTVPLNQIVTMLNFDMVGQGDGKVGMAGGELLGSAWDNYRTRLTEGETDSLNIYRTSTTWYGDYGPFHRAGVPSVSFWSSGEHLFYHQYEEDANHIRRECIESVGTRAQDFLLYLLNDYPYAMGRPDSVRLLVRQSTWIDWKGLDLMDALARPDMLSLPGIHLLWLPRERSVSTWNLIDAMSRVQRICDEKKVYCGTLPGALQANRRQQSAVVIGAYAQTLAGRSQDDIRALLRQGVSTLNLETAKQQKGGLDDATIALAKKAEVFVVMPIDYNTPRHVQKWENHSIVRASVSEFSSLSQEVLDSLATSPATLILDISGNTEQRDIDALRPYVERTICLDLGTMLQKGREEEASQAISRLYEAGLSRDDIILLVTENLRRLIH